MNVDHDIRKQFQSKLSDYRAPVPADGWERIERSMGRTATAAGGARRRWVIGSAAALLLLLIGSILFLDNPWEQSTPLISESSSPTADVEIKRGEREDLLAAGEATEKQGESPSAQSRRVTAYAGNNLSEAALRATDPVVMANAWLQRVNDPLNGAVRDLDREALRTLVSSLQHGEGDATSFIEEFITVGGEGETLYADHRFLNSRSDQLLLTVNGRGGLTSFQQTVNSPMTLRSAVFADDQSSPGDPNKKVLEANSTADNISEMEHDQPVSFGITISKSLIDDLFVETGLVYTYLSSKARNTNSNYQVQETQHLHYLGIPVNMNYRLFTLTNLNVYATVGGMLEKDIYGEFRKIGEGQTLEFNSSSEQEELTIISQRNPQLSVHAGLGLSYPIYQRLKLYGKIGGAYYFEADNAYKTIYSDSKIVMDLNVGLRYEFK